MYIDKSNDWYMLFVIEEQIYIFILSVMSNDVKLDSCSCIKYISQL